MPSYCTVEEVRRETPFKNTLLIKDAYIEAIIIEMSSLIDGYLIQAYVLPLPSVPAMIKSICKDLVACQLYRSQNTNEEIASGVDVSAWWDSLMQDLEAIANRKIALAGTDGSELPINKSKLPSFYPNRRSSDPRLANNTAPKIGINQKF